MQIGQHVLCIHDFSGSRAQRERARGHILPQQGVVYTVRDFYQGRFASVIRLQEIINPPFPYINGFQELSFVTKWFRPLTKFRVEDFLSEVVDA